MPGVAVLTAEGVAFGYDPNHDPADGPQELLRIATAKITFPSLGVTGSLRPYDPTARANVNAPADGEALATGRDARPDRLRQRLQARYGGARLRPAAVPAGPDRPRPATS